MTNFHIEKLVVTGNGKKPSIIEFCSGLNFIVGPSNTGKSSIFDILDYLFGLSPRKDKPFRFDESLGYNRFALHTQTSNGTLVFTRELGSSKICVSGTDSNFEHGDYSVSDSSKRCIKNVWLQMMGIDTVNAPKIFKNQNGDKQAFTWRSILHMFFVKQDDVARSTPLLLRPHSVNDTPSKWALLYMITGKDATSAETPESKEIRKAKRAAVISYIRDTVNRLSARESELLDVPIGDAIDIQNETARIVTEIEETQSQVTTSLSKSKKLMDEIYASNGKLTECETIADRFSALRSQYRSDIGRLAFIVEGEIGKADLPVNAHCPFCDSEIVPDGADSSYIEASRAELNHIRTHLTDLQKAENDVASEIKVIKARIAELEAEKEAVDTFIGKTLRPRIANLEQKLENYRRAVEISNEISVIQREERHLSAELFEKETEEDGTAPKYDYRQHYDYEMIRPFEERIIDILKNCHYDGYGSARFNMETFDIDVNNKPKAVAHGGGYCGLLNTVVAVALQEFLASDNALYRPSILAIDSPVSQLSEGEHKEESETMKASLFKYLLENHNSGQIIIIEQKEKMPHYDYASYSNVKYVEFTKDKNRDRYGFLNDVYSEKE